MPLLNLTFGTVPPGWCPQSEQQRLQMYAALLKAILNDTGSNVVIAAADPGPANYSKLWWKTTDGTDYPAGTMFFWFNGAWCAPHALPPGSIAFYPTGLAIADIGNYDGGVSTDALTAQTGPFWEEVSETKGRFPLHPDGGTYLVGGTGGEYAHMMTQAELFPHAHRRNPDGFIEDVHLPAGTPGTVVGDYGGTLPAIKQYTNTDVAGGDATHTQSAMPILPPWFGIALIRRTSRIYRTA